MVKQFCSKVTFAAFKEAASSADFCKKEADYCTWSASRLLPFSI